MSAKEFFRPNLIKVIVTLIFLAILFFLPIFPILQPYSPEIGAEYFGPLKVFGSLYYVYFDPYMGPELYWLSYIVMICCVIISYLISCLVVGVYNKIKK